MMAPVGATSVTAVAGQIRRSPQRREYAMNNASSGDTEMKNCQFDSNLKISRNLVKSTG
jgi:hypothetical protein